MNTIKKRLQSGEAVHGCWLNTGSAVAAEIVGHAGFDWVLLDLEHGAGSEAQLLPQLQAIGQDAAAPFVRVESFEAARVKRVLDMGAQGIMFPQIRSAEEAGQAIRHMYYPPKGIRGIAKMVRATGYAKYFDDYYRFAEDGLLGIIQIETKECLDHLDDIAAIDGVDVLFVGPADLSMALGVFGQWAHPDFVAAVQATGAAARRAGKAAGVLFFDVNQYDFYYDHGFRFLASGSDMLFISQGAGVRVQEMDGKRGRRS
jgi:4-hydroxy-2-oxoheptanedioate aldolase